MASPVTVEFIDNEERCRLGPKRIRELDFTWLRLHLRASAKKWNDSHHGDAPELDYILVSCHTGEDKIEITVGFRNSFSAAWETGYQYVRFAASDMATTIIINNIRQAWNDLARNLASAEDAKRKSPTAKCS